MKKCFAYLRVSGASQTKGDGFPRQEEAIRDYAKVHGLQVVEVFREKGVSGTVEDRPALARLMVSLEQNRHGVQTVIIEKLDRLARDLMVQEAIIRDFQKSGFNLVSAMEGPDLCGDDPTRKLFRQMMGAVAEYDKTMLVYKLKAARERARAKTGKCEGRKGYRDSEEGRAIIRKIRALRRKPKYGRRRTWQEIADRLNAEGVLTLDGNTWTLYRVQQTASASKRKVEAQP
jgi:DNA invertase Pin-like site-specific DNA recombinase